MPGMPLFEKWKRSSVESKKVAAAFVIAKLLVISVGIIATFLIPAEITGRIHVTDNEFLNAWAQYDARAYLDIAENGYNYDFLGIGNMHFYPLYPLLIAALSFIGAPLAAFIIANVASVLSVAVMYIIVKEEFGEKIAAKASVFLVFFPTAFYMTAMYTESLFLLLSLLVFWYARKGNWPAVALFGFLVSLTRIQGVFLFLPAVYLYLSSRGFSFRRAFSNPINQARKFNRNLLLFIAFPLAPLVLSLYQYATFGNFFAQFKSVAAWGKTFSPPWEGFVQLFTALVTDTSVINLSYHAFNLFMIIFFTFILWKSYTFLRKDYFIYMFVSYVILFFGPNLFGFARYIMVLFPAYITMSLLSEKSPRWKYAFYALYAVFIVVMVASIVLHVNERVHIGLLFDPIL